MVHLVVDDAVGWHEVAERVKREGGFDEVKIRAPQREDYGALVTHVIDPAGHLASLVRDRSINAPLIIGSVTGVEADPQILSAQVRKLTDVGVIVAPSNADAAALALRAIQD